MTLETLENEWNKSVVTMTFEITLFLSIHLSKSINIFHTIRSFLPHPLNMLSLVINSPLLDSRLQKKGIKRKTML